MADPYATCIRLTADITGFSSAMAIVTSTLLRTMGDVNRIQKGLASWQSAIMRIGFPPCRRRSWV